MYTINPFDKICTLDQVEVLFLRGNSLAFSTETKGLKKLNQYYKKLQSHWHNRFECEIYWNACLSLQEKYEQSRPFIPFHVLYSFEVDIINHELLSVTLIVEEKWGSKPRAVMVLHDLWHYIEGRPISTKEQLKLIGEKDLLPIAMNAIRNNNTVFLYKEFEKRAIEWFSPRRLYLSSEGVGLTYPQSTISPPAEGVPHFVLDVNFPK